MANTPPPHPLQPLWDQQKKFNAGNKGYELQMYEKEMLRSYDPKDYDLTALHSYMDFESDEIEQRIVYIVKSLKKNELNKITPYSFGKTALRMLVEDGRKSFIPLIKWLCDKGADPTVGLAKADPTIEQYEDEKIQDFTEDKEILKILDNCGKKRGGRRITRKRKSSRKTKKTPGRW